MTDQEATEVTRVKATIRQRLVRVEDVMRGLFDAIWDRLAMQSKCDARGSAEYARVRALFNPAMAWQHMEGWILDAANPTMPAATSSSSPTSAEPMEQNER